MTKPGFKIIMVGIKDAYGGKFQELTSSVLDTWFNCLSDLNEDRLREAASRYIKTHQFPPTIADLREAYRSVSEPKIDPYCFEERFKNVAPSMIAELLEAGLITAGGGVDYGDLTEVQFRALREAGAI